MTTKQLKEKLKAKAIAEMPDVKHRIDLSSIHVLPLEDAMPSKATTWSMKRILSYTFSILFVGLLSLGIYTSIQNQTDDIPFSTDEQLLMFQAVSAVSLVEDASIIETAFQIVPLADSENILIEDQIDVVNQYLNMMEVVLGDTDTMVTAVVDSDNESYSYCMLYRNIDLIGNLMEYHFYYNLETVDSNVSLQGILVHDDRSFAVEGIFYGDETEVDWLIVHSDNDIQVEVTNESLTSQQQFRYRVSDQGNVVNNGLVKVQVTNSTLTADIETENDTASLQMNVERVNASAGNHFMVRYQMTTGNVTKDGELEVNVAYDGNLGMYHYAYVINENGHMSSMAGGRGYKGNQAASEDDFTSVENPMMPGHGRNGKNSSGKWNPFDAITGNVPTVETSNL